MVNTKNILLVGLMGSGKSALGNVLLNKNGNFEEIFKESESSVNETRDIQVEEFEENGIKYRIIDTIGIGDNKLNDEEIAFKIFELCYRFKEGLTQVLFVVGGRFTREEIKIYNIIKKRFFDEDITKCTTIVRTRFHNFRDPKECEEEIKKLKKENKRNNKKIIKMVNSCTKVICVDNPSLNFGVFTEKELIINKREREISRNVLAKHLENCQIIYKPDSLKLINEIFGDYIFGDKQSRKNLLQHLKEEIGKLKKQGFFEKRMKQILNKKLETTEEIEKSSLKAVIEIRDICKQM